jgi:hypothetical protein
MGEQAVGGRAEVAVKLDPHRRSRSLALQALARRFDRLPVRDTQAGGLDRPARPGESILARTHDQNRRFVGIAKVVAPGKIRIHCVYPCDWNRTEHPADNAHCGEKSDEFGSRTDRKPSESRASEA